MFGEYDSIIKKTYRPSHFKGSWNGLVFYWKLPFLGKIMQF